MKRAIALLAAMTILGLSISCSMDDPISSAKLSTEDEGVPELVVMHPDSNTDAFHLLSDEPEHVLLKLTSDNYLVGYNHLARELVRWSLETGEHEVLAERTNYWEYSQPAVTIRVNNLTPDSAYWLPIAEYRDSHWDVIDRDLEMWDLSTGARVSRLPLGGRFNWWEALPTSDGQYAYVHGFTQDLVWATRVIDGDATSCCAQILPIEDSPVLLVQLDPPMVVDSVRFEGYVVRQLLPISGGNDLLALARDTTGEDRNEITSIKLTRWHVATRELQYSTTLGFDPTYLGRTPDGGNVLVGGGTGELMCFDLETGEPTTTFRELFDKDADHDFENMWPQYSTVRRAIFTHGGEYMITGNNAGFVEVWSQAYNTPLWAMSNETSHGSEYTNGLVLTSDEKQIIVATSHHIYIWDAPWLAD